MPLIPQRLRKKKKKRGKNCAFRFRMKSCLSSPQLGGRSEGQQRRGCERRKTPLPAGTGRMDWVGKKEAAEGKGNLMTSYSRTARKRRKLRALIIDTKKQHKIRGKQKKKKDRTFCSRKVQKEKRPAAGRKTGNVITGPQKSGLFIRPERGRKKNDHPSLETPLQRRGKKKKASLHHGSLWEGRKETPLDGCSRDTNIPGENRKGRRGKKKEKKGPQSPFPGAKKKVSFISTVAPKRGREERKTFLFR